MGSNPELNGAAIGDVRIEISPSLQSANAGSPDTNHTIPLEDIGVIAMRAPSPNNAMGGRSGIVHFATPSQLLCSRLVWIQLVFNMTTSAACPILVFWVLFVYLGEGPYEWWEGACSGVVVGSCVTSPILLMTLAPFGIPEALEQGWFFKVRQTTVLAYEFFSCLTSCATHPFSQTSPALEERHQAP
ncbi:MAG: hypothetical protein SGPRY_006876, partial [Prymnesium sp.]